MSYLTLTRAVAEGGTFTANSACRICCIPRRLRPLFENKCETAHDRIGSTGLLNQLRAAAALGSSWAEAAAVEERDDRSDDDECDVAVEAVAAEAALGGRRASASASGMLWSLACLKQDDCNIKTQMHKMDIHK